MLDSYAPLLMYLTMLSPLVGAFCATCLSQGQCVRGVHASTIAFMIISALSACCLCTLFFYQHWQAIHIPAYLWAQSADLKFSIGFLLDSLSVMMVTMIAFVSLLIHVYSIGYMQGESGYGRFFACVSFFTFAMMVLILSDNFLSLFFGWEGVGVASYFLIGYYYQKDSATKGAFKAFVVNRVGDLGLLLAMAIVARYSSSLNYTDLYSHLDIIAAHSINLLGFDISLVPLMALLTLIGVMGKSAQIPLHVWLPESMEGPTPISALIHAATMVTAGVYLIVRLSFVFECAPLVQSLILFIGASGALWLGLIGIVQKDIKRVVAFSTLSQLGYMVAATGASAYHAAIFHLLMHAFFKALLFLGAGSVIIGMHHQQDMRKMGGLKTMMPITYWTFMIGALSLTALPPFSGFFSKDAILTAVAHSEIFGATYASICLKMGAMVTAMYTFRLIFMVFYGECSAPHPAHESPWVMWLPLVLLSIPSAFFGGLLAHTFLGQGLHGLWSNVIFVHPAHMGAVNVLTEEYAQPLWLIPAALWHLPLYLTLMGIGIVYVFYIKVPMLPMMVSLFNPKTAKMLQKGYYFNRFYKQRLVDPYCALAEKLYAVADMGVIDQRMVLGSGRLVMRCGQWIRTLQTGMLFHYLLSITIGVSILLAYWIKSRLLIIIVLALLMCWHNRKETV